MPIDHQSPGQALASIDHVRLYPPGRGAIVIPGKRVIQVGAAAVPIVRTLGENGQQHDYVGMPFEVVMMSSSIVAPGPIVPPHVA